MEALDFNEHRKISLNILLCVSAFCEKHSLKYSLFKGTLLGAIRHNGYIPWDDDIDICMPREDYLFLINNFDNDNYGITACENNNTHFLPWAKAYDKNTVKIENISVSDKIDIGCNIDIYPLDYIDSIKHYWKIKKKVNKLIKKHHYSLAIQYHIHSLKDILKWIVFRHYRNKYHILAKKINDAFLNATNNKKYYVFNSVYNNIGKTEFMFSVNDFNEMINLQFEGYYFKATKLYDVVLNKLYGDYKTLPKKEEQIPHHSFKVYRR